MKPLKIIGMIIIILIFETYFTLRGRKRITINYQNKEAVEIPIKGGNI